MFDAYCVDVLSLSRIVFCARIPRFLSSDQKNGIENFRKVLIYIEIYGKSSGGLSVQSPYLSSLCAGEAEHSVSPFVMRMRNEGLRITPTLGWTAG